MNEATQSYPLGIVIERRPSDSPWQDATWRVVEVIPGARSETPWRLLLEEGSVSRFLACALPLSLHRKETEGYRVNLSQPRPMVYLVLRGDPGERPEPFLATACPYEGESYDLGGDERTEAVPMPAAIVGRVAAFIETHHVEEPFVKRKRKPHKDRQASKGVPRNSSRRRYG